MNLPPHLSCRNGHLYISECDTVALGDEFGTPLYVTDEDRIKNRYQEYHQALTSRYPHCRILYATKANGNLAIVRILAQMGAGADVFSSGELHLAREAGMQPQNLLFNGSSKTPDDLRLAVATGVTISLDSTDELYQLEAVASEMGQDVEVSFRVNPAINAPTHPKIATGLASSKFGIAADTIVSAYKAALSCGHLNPVGIHCHIGSQILAVEPFAREAEVLMQVVSELHKLGVVFKFVDLGGGLGIPYSHCSEEAPSVDAYAQAVIPPCKEMFAELGISPEIWVEPGRSLVCDSTLLLTRVNSVKKAHKNFVNVDAGFNLLIRPTMYNAYHEVIVANKVSLPADSTYTITGPICETGDILAHDRTLPKVSAGDIIAILDTGAYGFSMASQYNCRPRCAEVLVKGARAELMRRAETLDDIQNTMVTPSWHQR